MRPARRGLLLRGHAGRHAHFSVREENNGPVFKSWTVLENYDMVFFKSGMVLNRIIFLCRYYFEVHIFSCYEYKSSLNNFEAIILNFLESFEFSFFLLNHLECVQHLKNALDRFCELGSGWNLNTAIWTLGDNLANNPATLIMLFPRQWFIILNNSGDKQKLLQAVGALIASPL